jgi:hypothetical protein
MALEFLQKAKDVGFFDDKANVDRTMNNDELEWIRNRSGFKNLFGERK